MSEQSGAYEPKTFAPSFTWITTDEPCPSGHTDCTVDCGACKGTGRRVTGRRKPAASGDLCHNGHPFEPGQDADALDEPGSPLWCDVCGEARRTTPQNADQPTANGDEVPS